MLRKTGFIFLALLIMSGYVIAAEEAEKEKPKPKSAIKWFESVSDAQMEAFENEKPVLVYIFQSKG